MQNKKCRVICLILALFVMISCIEILDVNHQYNMQDCDVINRYSAATVTLYDPITTNSEICTMEMLGTKNASRFVRVEKRTSYSVYIKISDIMLCNPEIEDCSSKIYKTLISDNLQISSADIAIVDYIHSTDGEK